LRLPPLILPERAREPGAGATASDVPVSVKSVEAAPPGGAYLTITVPTPGLSHESVPQSTGSSTRAAPLVPPAKTASVTGQADSQPTITGRRGSPSSKPTVQRAPAGTLHVQPGRPGRMGRGVCPAISSPSKVTPTSRDDACSTMRAG
jgi:hypothetical protein